MPDLVALPVVPTVDIPESPIDTFELMFTPELMEQSNVYAKVMGEERYATWKITQE